MTFRGTINAMDLVIDLSVVPAPLVGSGGSTDIMVPSGMLASVVWEEPYIIAAINELMESRLRAATAAATTTTNAAAGTRQSGHGFSKIVFAGHSLGGGLATVCALRFVDLHRFPELRRIVRTFGSPQVSRSDVGASPAFCGSFLLSLRVLLGVLRCVCSGRGGGDLALGI